MAANEIFFDRYPDSVLEHQIQVRPYNALKTRNMRSLNPEGKMVWMQCLDVRTENMIYYLYVIQRIWDWIARFITFLQKAAVGYK